MQSGIYGILELEKKVDISRLVQDLSNLKTICYNKVHTPTWNDLMVILMKNEIEG